jgi:hypothetical protein
MSNTATGGLVARGYYRCQNCDAMRCDAGDARTKETCCVQTHFQRSGTARSSCTAGQGRPLGRGRMISAIDSRDENWVVANGWAGLGCWRQARAAKLTAGVSKPGSAHGSVYADGSRVIGRASQRGLREGTKEAARRDRGGRGKDGARCRLCVAERTRRPAGC